MNKEVIARFWSKVDVKKKNQCWDWKANISPNGYGKISVNNRPHSAHRIAFEFFHGDIKNDFVIDHKCRNRKCVNPVHLRQVTRTINCFENSESLPAKYISRVKCSAGHEYSPNNLLINKEGHRLCKVCRKNYRDKNRKRARDTLTEMGWKK